jgi:hypothetical protein
MFAHLWPLPPAMRRQPTRSTGPLRVAGAIALGLLAGGCVATGRPITGADPSNPTARVAATTYRSVVSGYVSQRPVEPAPWREQNERVTPPPKH